jgi:hypothetical protein
MTAIRKPSPDARKAILRWTAFAIVLSGLFPPWLYIFDKGNTSDTAGGHWEVSAGYASLIKPPTLDIYTAEDRNPLLNYFTLYKARAGLRLDTARLLVEWVCILAVSGAAWGLVRLDRERISEANQRPQGTSA